MVSIVPSFSKSQAHCVIVVLLKLFGIVLASVKFTVKVQGTGAATIAAVGSGYKLNIYCKVGFGQPVTEVDCTE